MKHLFVIIGTTAIATGLINYSFLWLVGGLLLWILAKRQLETDQRRGLK